MNRLTVTDRGSGQVEVSWQQGNSVPRTFREPLPFASPLDAAARAELRWYLEEFLGFPYGAERDRAKGIEQQMEAWGNSLFGQVFPKRDADLDPRGFYQEAVRTGLEKCALCISSDDADFLNVPWELLRDPTPGRGYLAPLLAGLFRQRTEQAIQAIPEPDEADPFRILLVIARPYGPRDVPLGTVARPMLQALRKQRPRVQLDLLRPPTFDALQQQLNANRGKYHLVHFDGHGVFVPPGNGPLHSYGIGQGKGHLVFERDDGSEHVVDSKDLGQALATCKVPLFVLNACQSAQEGGTDPFASVAAQLVAVGAQGVVAMSYSVYAQTAASFVERFYEQLVSHNPLSQAVAAARLRLFTDPHRNSVVGPLELRDWIVPTLYQQQQDYVPMPKLARKRRTKQDTAEEDLRTKAEAACPEGQFGFVGRDYDLLRIERALRDDRRPWALLTGIGGTGKTELARGFARWFAETGGCPGGVFTTRFLQKADFGQVVGSIVGFGTDFSRLPAEEQRKQLTAHLKANACLLLWDNFEPVAGYPEGTEPLATDEQRALLADFLKGLRGGKSRVLITTRKPDEKWLGIAYERVEVTGLVERDAGELAKVILKTVGRRPEDFGNDPNYSLLLRLLRGHARSLEVILPQLEKQTSGQLIESLQDRMGSESLDIASLSEAFQHLSERARRHLPFIGLFASLVHADVLGMFVGSGDEQQQLYIDVMAEALDAKGWEMVLEEAARAGLLRSIGQRRYELHPTLAPFLRHRLALVGDEAGLARLESEFLSFYSGWAARISNSRSLQGGNQGAVNWLRFEETNFLRALRLAETCGHWTYTQAIAQTLWAYYEICNRVEEWKGIRTEILSRIGRRIPIDVARDRANLWVFLLVNEANQVLCEDVQSAESSYKLVLEYLTALGDPNVEGKIAATFHHLGIVAQNRSQFDLAEEWFGKALEITESLSHKSLAMRRMGVWELNDTPAT